MARRTQHRFSKNPWEIGTAQGMALPDVNLLEPEFVFPEEVRRELRPEQLLLLAHLEHTFRAVLRGEFEESAEVCEGWLWVFYDTRTGPQSFVYVCEHLNFDRDELRGRLRSLLVSLGRRWLSEVHCRTYAFRPPTRRPQARVHVAGRELQWRPTTKLRGRASGLRAARSR